ncbi:MAG: glycosyltransferase [Peptostreptococcus sp.]|jgi:glycosyltransferase involved in cell wall biosynthesis|uniref:glycosyltransferase n=1 Tax=Peptostreptococcus TaxID=1257 RepID=UPI00232F3F38|nr:MULTISPECIES: glycosyltransferase [Peptostreptococcus]MDB8850816.1 glycosyltransferase [Peptostreptococcus anaerobius]MDB8854516.1 glycosyltransferase [Peptostreptococcus anaerobius]MDB8856383.1 glycosyltransferase [Peptostreptococcus anaerobius]MDU1175261.1 glycosyltransferase [Peptostreptococcus anaerobius]MDU1233733.1 glycosyltransferase [Peptostreptococcus anaerobius]
MRVLIARNSDAPTNANIRRVLEALTSAGHSVVVLSRNRACNESLKGYIKKTIKINNLEIDNYELQLSGKTERGMKNFTTLKSYMDSLKSWMKDNVDKFDAIHAFDLDTGLVAKKIAKSYNKHLVYHIADFYVDSRAKIPGPLKFIIRSMEYSIINYADNTIICTEERKDQIAGSRPRKLTVVHNTPSIDFDVSSYIDQSMDPDHKLTLAYIGVLSKRRFIDQAVDCMMGMKDSQMILAGGGDLVDFVKERAEKTDNIKYKGKVDYEDTFDIYSKSDLMFAVYNPQIMNHKYSAANKIYEAMLLKKPIIVARGTSMDKIVERYDIGFVIDYDKNEFRDLLYKLEKDRSIIDKKVENMQGVYENYSWETMKKRLIDVYSDLERD